MSRAKKLAGSVLAGLALAAGLIVSAAPPQAQALSNGLAATPPLGWNDWNSFHQQISAQIIEQEARALVRSGMKAAGYDYVILDGGWDLLARDANGNLQADPSKFPDGIKPVVDYVHSLHLKFGIHLAAGPTNCAGNGAGALGHYTQDAQTLASWGIDYLKFDSCGVPASDDIATLDALYGQMRDALAATGRPILFSIHMPGQPVSSANPSVANMWRTTPDATPTFASVVSRFTTNSAYASLAGPGAWNDPDMLETGNDGTLRDGLTGSMTVTDSVDEFSLWAEMAAPLIAGNDLTAMTQATRKILTNRAVIAVDQDPLGRQGYPVASANGLWVLTKPLANGDRAVVLFNQNDTAATITTSAAQAGLRAAASYKLTNLWTHKASHTRGTITADVPAQAVVMYRVSVNGK